MATINKGSTSFKIFESPEEERHQNFRTLNKEYQIRTASLEQSFSDLGTGNRTSRINSFVRRGNTEDSLEPATSTKTPETVKVSPVVPNAPIKPPRTGKKIDMRPKRLQFMEEAENSSTMDSGVLMDENTRRYPTRNTRNVNYSETHRSSSSKGKRKSTSIGKRSNTSRITSSGASTSRGEGKRKPTSVGRQSNTSTTTSSGAGTSQREGSVESAQLSLCSSGASWQDRLKWLQRRRDIGLWIQCCQKNCGKWRFNDRIHDPVDVPEIWYCHMHHDPLLANCDYPEEEISSATENQTIFNKYNAGSLVWAKLRGYPWWPALVDDCPVTFRYYQLPKNSKTPNKYCVTYFGEPVQTSWLPVNSLQPYQTNPRDVFLKRKKMVYQKTSYADQLEASCNLADEAIPLSISERLLRFSFLARSRGEAEEDESTEADNESDEVTIDEPPTEPMPEGLPITPCDEVICLGFFPPQSSNARSSPTSSYTNPSEAARVPCTPCDDEVIIDAIFYSKSSKHTRSPENSSHSQRTSESGSDYTNFDQFLRPGSLKRVRKQLQSSYYLFTSDNAEIG